MYIEMEETRGLKRSDVTLNFQLQLCKGISYAAVATHADNCGRRKLAAMLVEHEPRSTKQVCLS